MGVGAEQPPDPEAAAEQSAGGAHCVHGVARVDHFEQQRERQLEREPELDDEHKGGARARARAEQRVREYFRESTARAALAVGACEEGVHRVAARRGRAPAAPAAAVELERHVESAGAAVDHVADDHLRPNVARWRTRPPADARVAVRFAHVAGGRPPERALRLRHLRREPPARTHRLRALREARPRVPSAGVLSSLEVLMLEFVRTRCSRILIAWVIYEFEYEESVCQTAFERSVVCIIYGFLLPGIVTAQHYIHSSFLLFMVRNYSYSPRGSVRTRKLRTHNCQDLWMLYALASVVCLSLW